MKPLYRRVGGEDLGTFEHAVAFSRGCLDEHFCLKEHRSCFAYALEAPSRFFRCLRYGENGKRRERIYQRVHRSVASRSYCRCGVVLKCRDLLFERRGVARCPLAAVCEVADPPVEGPCIVSPVRSRQKGLFDSRLVLVKRDGKGDGDGDDFAVWGPIKQNHMRQKQRQLAIRPFERMDPYELKVGDGGFGNRRNIASSAEEDEVVEIFGYSGIIG